MLPTKLGASYTLLDKLGVGGTAVVYKVQDKSTNQFYALKLQSETTESNGISFQHLAERELQLTQNLNFPGIIKIHEISTDEPEYILLDYCPGRTLDKRGKVDNLQAALHLLSSIAVNLEYIHSRGIIHADLKPENIFLPQDESVLITEGLFYTKLFDFSLGKNTDEDDSKRIGVGTIGYMAPEIVDSKNVTIQSDLFAFGVIAYQILTGEHPFINGETDPVLINSKIKEDEPRPITDFRSDLSDEIVLTIESLLEKDEKKRTQTAQEVYLRLRECGSKYPLDRALQPKHFIIQKNPEFIFEYLDIDDSKQKEMSELYKSYPYLRSFLSYNHIRKNLQYKDGNFSFKQNGLLPLKLVTYELHRFQKLSLTEKKEVIRAAVINNPSFALAQNIEIETTHILSKTLPHFLCSKTVSTIAHRYAPIAKEMNFYKVAAELYCKAGDLTEAEDAAFQAASELRNDNDLKEAVRIIDKVIELANLKKDLFSVRSLIKLKGDVLKELGETGETEAVYKKLISIYADEKHDKLLAETYKNLGDLYKTKQKPQEGLDALEHALAIYEELGDELEISHTFNNLGTIYWVDNNYENAFVYFRKALKIQRKLNVKKEIASTLNNLAVMYTVKGKYKRAINLFTICVKIQKEIGIKSELARTLNNLGYIYMILADYDKSIDSILESITYFKEIGTQTEILINLENLTSITFITARLNESIKYLKEGIKISNDLGEELQIGIFKVFLSGVFIRMGRVKDADKIFQEIDSILSKHEDAYLRIIYLLEKANLSLFLNNTEKVRELVLELYQVADKLQDKTTLVKIKLLECRLLDSDEVFESTNELISELKLVREDFLFEHVSLENTIRDKNFDAAKEYVEKLERKRDLISIDIEYPAICNTIAEYYLHKNDLEQALYYIEQAIHIASKNKLKFEYLTSLVLKGKVLFQQNEVESCYNIYREALQIAKQIALDITHPSEQQLFQQKKEIHFLIKEIKDLSNLLSKKKEQVN